MTRRTLTPAAERRIAETRHWRAPEGEPLCLENGEVVFLGTGKRPEWDHIFPLADGGGNEDDNFQPISPEVHQKKSNTEATARAKGRRRSRTNKEPPKRQWSKGRPLSDPYWKKKLDRTVVRRV